MRYRVGIDYRAFWQPSVAQKSCLGKISGGGATITPPPFGGRGLMYNTYIKHDFIALYAVEGNSVPIDLFTKAWSTIYPIHFAVLHIFWKFIVLFKLRLYYTPPLCDIHDDFHMYALPKITVHCLLKIWHVILERWTMEVINNLPLPKREQGGKHLITVWEGVFKKEKKYSKKKKITKMQQTFP